MWRHKIYIYTYICWTQRIKNISTVYLETNQILTRYQLDVPAALPTPTRSLTAPVATKPERPAAGVMRPTFSRGERCWRGKSKHSLRYQLWFISWNRFGIGSTLSFWLSNFGNWSSKILEPKAKTIEPLSTCTASHAPWSSYLDLKENKHGHIGWLRS